MVQKWIFLTTVVSACVEDGEMCIRRTAMMTFTTKVMVTLRFPMMLGSLLC